VNMLPDHTLPDLRRTGATPPDPADILDAPDDALVCHCDGVTKAKVLRAIKEGARSLQDVEEMTGACRTKRCTHLSPRKRCCAAEIKALLRQAATERTSTPVS
jgi:NAD(P)H-nitrite reductase large subunit